MSSSIKTKTPAKNRVSAKPRPTPASRKVSSVADKAAVPSRISKGVALALALLVVAAGAWSYWPTLVALVAAWEREPDYSHGFLVPPLAAFFLWTRRRDFPGVSFDGRMKSAIVGVGFLLASFAVRVAGSLAYLDAADGWSLPLFIAGAVCMLCGYRVAAWSAPAIAFLWFMMPLPYTVERWFSLPLQHIATRLSTYGLQILGLPAISEGNTILLGENRLEVVEACSGLRIFTGIAALAFAYVILTRRAWWERGLLMLATVPVALIANAVRIIGTGLLYEFVDGETARHFSHDLAGWIMIPLAAALFGAALWYLGKLFPTVEQIGVSKLVHDDVA